MSIQIINQETGALLDGLHLAQVIDLNDSHGIGRVQIYNKQVDELFWAFVVEGVELVKNCEVVYAFHYNDPSQVCIIQTVTKTK
jgi:hypothetical protein